jgi:hypothetical protein
VPLIERVTQNLGSGVEGLSAEYPILLMPVRMETRFFGPPQLLSDELWIRVYPDGIFTDLHETKLTEEERDAGIAYWTSWWANPANEAEAWRNLVFRRRPARAAYIVKTMKPENPGEAPGGTPDFPDPELRTDMWTKTPETRLLPDRWTVIAYRDGAEVGRVVGKPIPDPLALGLNPSPPSLVNYDGLSIEPGLRWLVDFQEAETKGMALRMPLSAADVADGFDRLLVFGVKANLGPEDARARLETALDSHHYTRGLALVRQGTPTNNSLPAPSGYPPPDDPNRTFSVERGASLVASDRDGGALSRALGVATTPTCVFDHVEGSDGLEQKHAWNMNYALWPCTLGYFLEQLMKPVLSAANIDLVRGHFQDYVRGRGPLPAFRVAGIPYGVLPVTSLQRWTPAGGANALDVKLPDLLKSWRSTFLGLSSNAPHVGKTSDPDADLLEILGLDASAREVRLREVLGEGWFHSMCKLLGLNPNTADAARPAIVSLVLGLAGLGGLSQLPRLTKMLWADDTLRFAHPFAAPEPLSEFDSLVVDATSGKNYIEEVRVSDVGDLHWSLVLQGRRNFPLLYHLLRQAALVEYNRVGTAIAIPDTAAAMPVDLMSLEMVNVAPVVSGNELTIPRPTLSDRFAQPVSGLTAPGESLEDWMFLGGGTTDPNAQPVRDFRAALDVLAPLPTAELDRLVTETLDTCSHRLDAWITSLATKRLAAMRVTKQTGVHLGAYGWVENLRKQVTARANTPRGFIHAPTPTHAAAAAILRNAHLTRVGDLREQVRVDLSSRRVRNALRLLDGIREGQPLGALLGYRFERALHDHSPPLDQYIDDFRRAYPLGADPAGTLPADPTERIPARDVVNGLTLRDAWRASEITWGANGLPESTPTTTDYLGTVECLKLLDDDIDAAADLLVAESVFQAVRGNVDSSRGTLATLAGGGTVPDPQIVAPATAGIAFTQRVAIVLGDLGTLAGWPTQTTPRRDAEPRLNQWLGGLFDDPADIRCRVSHSGGEATITLEDLGLQPVDFVAAARRTSSDGKGELAARIEFYARTSPLGLAPPFQILYEPTWQPSEARTFLEAIEVAREAIELLDRARPLAPPDLVESGQIASAAYHTDDLDDRVDAVAPLFATTLSTLIAQTDAATTATPPVNLDPLRNALWQALLFDVPSAVPVDLHGTDDPARVALVDQGRRVQAELDRRQAELSSAGSAPLAKLTAILGKGVLILPRFEPDKKSDLNNPLDDVTHELLDGDVLQPRRWFQRWARVRAPLARLRTLALTARATAGAILNLEVAQLPLAATDRWIALPFDPETPPPAGVLSMVVHRALGFGGNPSWAGLLIDEWTETIPSAKQTTGFAVHHDSPAAEAPQAVLLAVPPTSEVNWDTPSLVDTLNETFDLAKIRSVDLDLLNSFYMLAPTIYCAGNVENDCASNDLGEVRQANPVILPPE